jgi:hypothetical protein
VGAGEAGRRGEVDDPERLGIASVGQVLRAEEMPGRRSNAIIFRV